MHQLKQLWTNDPSKLACAATIIELKSIENIITEQDSEKRKKKIQNFH